MTMVNPEISYLMGGIFAKGQINRSHDLTKVIMELPHKGLRINGKDPRLYVDASLLRIQQRIQPVVGNPLNITSVQDEKCIPLIWKGRLISDSMGCTGLFFFLMILSQ